MPYEIWVADTANLLCAFDSEDEAWEMLGQALDAHGPDYVASLIFGVEDEAGESRLIATGPNLVERTIDRRTAEAENRTARVAGASD